MPKIDFSTDGEISTQTAFGKILDSLSKGDTPLAERIMTTSPDVAGTTSLGPWVNRRKLFARTEQKDAFIEHRIPSTAKWKFAPTGQHIEPGIAGMNLFLLLSAVAGPRVVSHGVEHFGQTATIDDLVHHFGLDRFSLAKSVMHLT